MTQLLDRHSHKIDLSLFNVAFDALQHATLFTLQRVNPNVSERAVISLRIFLFDELCPLHFPFMHMSPF